MNEKIASKILNEIETCDNIISQYNKYIDDALANFEKHISNNDDICFLESDLRHLRDARNRKDEHKVERRTWLSALKMIDKDKFNEYVSKFKR